MPLIETVEQLREALANGPYAWPGGYPLFYLTADGGTLLPSTVKTEQEQIEEAITDGPHANDQWRVVAVDVNWEDPDMIDDHTNERIPSAYADD